MLLNLVTPQKKLLTGAKITEVVVPANKGQLDILPGHSPLVTTLSAGIMKYKNEGETNYNAVAISWGYCEVTPTGVQILAETAEVSDELELARIEAALSKSDKKLREGLTVGDTIKYQRKQQRARARLELLKNYSK